MFCCRGKRLANYLIEHGSKIVRIDCDQKAKGFLVFIFEDDDSIKKNMQTWKKDKEMYLI
jgi:uncharacterized UPF0146 family protein